ncbi:MAG: radical SAM family heme chaperone HemW [Clostridiaceae bacterium]|jgi:oxygen-independent coproporphyrinogen-3 oxidase|nr:radical SAM family heme chaperone HemW [Clostridiaceae bacterium]
MSQLKIPNSLTGTVSSLYIHVPFCQSKCHYCDFYSISTADSRLLRLWHERVQVELQRLQREAESNGVTILPLKTIYYGGGTPSLLPFEFLSEELELCRQLFGLAEDAEITLEANPEQIKSEKIAADWLSIGFNRLSIGLQSASDHLLRVMGRRHSREDAFQAVTFAHQAGFRNISLDLISGLPDAHMSDIEDTLAFIAALPLTHLSCYALDVPSHTRFAEMLAADSGRFPDDRLEREMFHRIREVLIDRGFKHYEISNFALESFQSRHNTVYWRAEPYLAAGPAASSYLAGIRRSNPDSLLEWSKTVLEQGPFSAENITEIITEDEARRESILLGLRLLSGVNAGDFQQRHAIDYRHLFAAQIEKLSQAGLLDFDGETLRLTREGEDFCNIVFREFV